MTTVKEIEAEVEAILGLYRSGRSATARHREDRLYIEVLRAIAEGDCENPFDCAEAVCKLPRRDD